MATVVALALLAAPSPWWGTWWFRGLAFLAITSLLAVAHRARMRAIQARSQRLEREVSDRRHAQEALARSEQQLRLILTDRVRSEEAVRRQHEQLAHASRVLTLGELAAALAHELNQPLTAILSNAQATLMLQEQHHARKGDVREALQDIAHDAARAGDIIRKLRDLARRGESNREPMDLNQAIIGVEPLMHASALEHEVALEMQLFPTLPPAQGDVIQMQQVILNLARNGMEAMRTVPRDSRRLRILSRREGCSAVVEITDTGSAISDETFHSLFVPFYTTKAGGLGMGLAITRSIVEAHGGRIAAERNRGDGLTISFTIPLLRSEYARPAGLSEVWCVKRARGPRRR